MFFRSSGKNKSSPEPQSRDQAVLPVAPLPPASSPPTQQLHAAPLPAAGSRLGGEPTAEASNVTIPGVSDLRADADDRTMAVVGQLVVVLARTKAFSRMTLSELSAMAGPAIDSGQIAIATVNRSNQSRPIPVAAVLWARVSADVDKRLSQPVDGQVRLAPRDWVSGDIPWVMVSAGEPRVLQPLLSRLSEQMFNGRPLRARTRTAAGQFVVREIAPKPRDEMTTSKA